MAVSSPERWVLSLWSLRRCAAQNSIIEGGECASGEARAVGLGERVPQSSGYWYNTG